MPSCCPTLLPHLVYRYIDIRHRDSDTIEIASRYKSVGLFPAINFTDDGGFLVRISKDIDELE